MKRRLSCSSVLECPLRVDSEKGEYGEKILVGKV